MIRSFPPSRARSEQLDGNGFEALARMADRLQGGRGAAPDPPRLPAHGGTKPRARRRAAVGRHEDGQPQDGGDVSALRDRRREHAARGSAKLEALLEAPRGAFRVVVPLRNDKVSTKPGGVEALHEGLSVAEIAERIGREMVGRDGIERPTPGFSVRALLVIHGDEFDGVTRCHRWLPVTGDFGYEVLLVLNRWFNHARRMLGFGYWSLSAYVKWKSKRAVSFVADFEASLVHEATRRSLQAVICGHIHKAEMRWIGRILYCNTADWVESCTALVEHPGGELELLTSPGGTPGGGAAGGARLGRGRSRLGAQHGSTNLCERAARVHGAPAQLAEGLLLRHGVASHHEPLGLLDDLPVRQGLPELLQIAVALHGQVQRGRDLCYAHWLEQVGHHATVPGHLDEPATGAPRDEHHGATGLVAEAGDHLAARPDRRRRDQGNVRPAAVDGADGLLGRLVLEDDDPAGGVN